MKLLFSSLAVRQAVISTFVVLVAILGFGALALVSVRHAARADLLHTVDTDIAGLADGMVQGGPAELERRISDRTGLLPTTSAAPYYGLYDRTGHRLAGNLAEARPGANARIAGVYVGRARYQAANGRLDCNALSHNADRCHAA